MFTRVAQRRNAVYVDLADQDWRAVKITQDGWQVVKLPKVRFCRPRGMEPLPMPRHGSSVDLLRKSLHLGQSNDWYIIVIWLVGALNPNGPYIVLVLNGEQGSAKSTTARMLRALVDPNKSPLRTLPRDERDLAIAANNGRIVALDNVSYIPDWLSDGLSRLSTGAGLGTRQLYEDDAEKLFFAQRPVLLNGIDSVVTRGDLLDRSLVVNLPVFKQGARRTIQSVWQEFEKDRPGILGALFDAVSGALGRRDSIELENLPRMADAALWVTAAEPALGWTDGRAVKALEKNKNELNSVPLDASPITPALRALLRTKKGLVEGPSQKILDALRKELDDPQRPPKGFPRTPESLSLMLKRLAPNLRRAGVEVTTGLRTRDHREIKIEELEGSTFSVRQEEDEEGEQGE